jgi:hypothetical protein
MSEPFIAPAKVRSIWPPILLFALAVAYTWGAQDYGRIPRLMPTTVGISMAVLAVLDLLSRFDTALGRAIQVTLGADFGSPEMNHDPALRQELAIIGAMLGCVVAMLMIGILPTIPLFIALYMRFWGHRSWLSSLITAVLVLAFVAAVFELALGTTLYRGVLFDPRGFSRW